MSIMVEELRDVKVPSVLSSEPRPEPEMRSFHRKRLLGWNGKVRVDQIHGWVRNRRTDLFTGEFKEKYGREPTNDEVYEFMRDNEKEFQLRALAKNIAQNGVRQDIILDADGTLRDGNRRYFATRYAIDEKLAPKEELEYLPAWVLTADASDEDKRLILVETNFLPSFKVDWPQYVKASVMFEDYHDRNVSYDDLANRYGMSKARVRSMVKAMDLVEEFITYWEQKDPSIGERAQNRAYEDFTLFEEAHNKFRGLLDTDIDFKERFFQWMLDDIFKGITDVRRLGEIRSDQEAWDTIRDGTEDAVKQAIHIVDGKKLPPAPDGERKFRTVIRLLRDLKEWEITSITPQTLQELTDLLTDVRTMAAAVNSRGSEEENA